MTDSAQGGPSRDELPVADYDHLPLGSLGHRIRSLDGDGVRQLVAYERAHGSRVPVLAVLEARLNELAKGAKPSDGDPSADAADVTAGMPGKSPVSPTTEGPTLNPPSHGVPTNPAQPRPTG